MTADEYPRRDSHYAHRVVRVLQKSCAASEIGHAACLLVTYVAHTEDAIRYSAPVKFWNEQLMSTLSFSSPKQLNNARQKAIDAGWLVYLRDGNRHVGKYWVTIPAEFAELSDRPIESNHSPTGTNSGTNSGTNCGTNCGTNEGMNGERIIPPAEREGDELRNEKVTNSGMKSGKHSNPLPKPNPPPPPIQDFQAAADLLNSRKVDFTKDAIDAAFAAGATLTDIEAIVAFFDSRPGAWTPAALQKRVKSWVRGQAPESGWPPPAKRFSDAEAAERKAERQAEERREADLKALAHRRELERLEREYGAELASMPDQALLDFIATQTGGAIVRKQLKARGRNDAGVRFSLLSWLAASRQLADSA